jgi:3-deoxy-7-phosphoheptulonate synthase
MISAASPHSFLGVNGQGRIAIVRTAGNKHAHVVLRGGGGRPNYDTVSVALTEQALTKSKLPQNIVVDCSHANSFKKPESQPLVLAECVNQLRAGNRSIVGLMLESNLLAGNQSIPADLSKLVYGQSVTDGCIDWATTETALRDAAAALKEVLPGRLA